MTLRMAADAVAEPGMETPGTARMATGAEHGTRQAGGAGKGPRRAAEALLAHLRGQWTCRREIEDRRAGREGRFEGEASFGHDGIGLAYAEAGVLELPGTGAFRAERRYLWRAVPAGIAVLHENGTPFHAFDPRGDRPAALHRCEPDLYHVVYTFEADAWSSVWDVTGPRKSYRLVTRYARAPGRRASAEGALARARGLRQDTATTPDEGEEAHDERDA